MTDTAPLATSVARSIAEPIVCPRCGSDLFNIPRTDAFCTATRQIEPSFVDDMTINCAECGHEMEDERAAIVEAYYEVARLAETGTAEGLDTPYPLFECLRILVDFADTQLNERSCDCHGYEIIREASKHARQYLTEPPKENANATE